MSVASVPIVGSPDITSLAFSVLYDISGAVPAITLTNFSAVVHASNLTWSLVITTPSGTTIYAGPVAVSAAWSVFSTPPNSWPLLFTNQPCGQVEFATGAPYVCILSVQDSLANTYSLTVNQIITRPNGNTPNICGNFGVAPVEPQVTCSTGTVLCKDTTNYAYQSQLIPTSQNNNWILVYPPDQSGNQPANGTASNTPYVTFPIRYSGSGYYLYLQDYASYDMGNGSTIKVQYKAINPEKGTPGIPFAVQCNINFCQVQCQITTFYELSKKTCGVVDLPQLDRKITDMNLLLTQAIIGVMQPLCGIDVPELIKKIQKIGPLDPNCNCGCSETGINFNYPTGPSSSAGGCCPVTVSIVNVTASPPTTCANTVFPVQVYDPTYTTIIGIAPDISTLIYLLNITPSWNAYGTAFSEGLCQVGFFPSTPGNTIPAIHIANASSSSGCIGNTQLYVVNLSDICFPATPISSSSYPLNVFVDFGLGGGPVYVGNVATQAAMIAALNATPTKPSTITFSVGSVASSIVIFNSSCTVYSGTINVTCDAGSTSFLAYGPAHMQELTSPPLINGAVEGYGLHSNALIGKIPGVLTNEIQWHTIIIGTHLLVTETTTGRVYCYNISNPLFPVLSKVVQLNKVVTACFSGFPASRGITGSAVASFYSLYFPTDYSNMSLTSVYVVEGLTGSTWNINMDPASSTGVISSFQSNLLIGKCPRCIVVCGLSFVAGPSRPFLILTQDGSLEGDTGLSSGVTPGQIVVVDLSNYTTGGVYALNTSIVPNSTDVWAASYDGASTIYFMCQNGTIFKGRIDPSTGFLIFPGPNYVTSIMPALNIRLNIRYYQGSLFLSGLLNQGATTVNAYVLNAFALPTVSVVQFAACPGNQSAANHVHNILPLGNCLVLVTGEGGDPGAATGIAEGAVMVYKTDGTFLMFCNWQVGQSVYNLSVIPNQTVYIPNGLV